MTAILISTEKEASVFLKEYERGRFDGLNEGEAARDEGFIVGLTGIGKIKATLRSERFLRDHDVMRIVHIGTCAALNPELENGSVVAAAQVFEGDRIELAAPTYPRMPLEVPFENLRQVTLVTQDHTIQDDEEYSYWQRIADITDMTGYAVAYVAATYGIPCHIVKIVTSKVKEDSRNFQKGLAAAHQKISTFLREQVIPQ